MKIVFLIFGFPQRYILTAEELHRYMKAMHAHQSYNNIVKIPDGNINPGFSVDFNSLVYDLLRVLHQSPEVQKLTSFGSFTQGKSKLPGMPGLLLHTYSDEIIISFHSLW